MVRTVEVSPRNPSEKHRLTIRRGVAVKRRKAKHGSSFVFAMLNSTGDYDDVTAASNRIYHARNSPNLHPFAFGGTSDE